MGILPGQKKNCHSNKETVLGNCMTGFQTGSNWFISPMAEVCLCER